MKGDKITIKVSKEKPANYLRDTSVFESITYREVGEGQGITHPKKVGSFLETLQLTVTRWSRQSLRYITGNWREIPQSFVVKATVKLTGVCLTLLKGILLLTYYLALSFLELTKHTLRVVLHSLKRSVVTHQRRPKAYDFPVEEEWWRYPPKPQTPKKKRTIRVTVEVEE